MRSNYCVVQVLANTNKLRVVLISSEGTIMPLLAKLSATNRVIIYEVGDVHDDDAVWYLVRGGVDESLAKKLVNCMEGEWSILEAVFTYWGRARRMEGLNRSTRTSKKIFSRMLNAQKLVIETTKPESEAIFKRASEEGYILPAQLVRDTGLEKDKINYVLGKLIEANILRYDEEGCVTWHGK